MNKVIPKYVLKFLLHIGFSSKEVQQEIEKPIPALGNKSIVEALNEGKEAEVKQVLLRWADAMGVTDKKIYDILPED